MKNKRNNPADRRGNYTGYRGQARWQIAAQYAGFGVIMASAVCMDGVMDTFGIGGFLFLCGGGIILAGVLIWAGNLRLRKRKSRSRWREHRERRAQRAA